MNKGQTCFGCQHSHNMGAPNVNSPVCMDQCRRGSEFTPFNGDAKAEELKKNGKEIDAMAGFMVGIGFCLDESDGIECQDCMCLDNCQTMIKEDLRGDDLSLNPVSHGPTLDTHNWPATGAPPEPEGTVFRGIRREPWQMENMPNLADPRPLEGIPGELCACKICNHKHLAENIMEQDMKRAMLSTQTPVILKVNESEIAAIKEDFAGDDGPVMVDEFETKSQEDDDGVLRSFDTGATRDTGGNKLCYDKFLSPYAIKQFAKYMNMNRLQSDGKLRDGDNWQKGIPMPVYVESEGRHHHEAWEFFRELKHRDRDGEIEGIGALCGILFNVMGWLHEWLKENEMIDFDGDEPTFEMKERREKINGNVD